MRYYPTVVASKKANGILYKQLLAQARLAAFFDIFTVLALLMIVGIFLVMLLKNKQTKKKKQSA